MSIAKWCLLLVLISSSWRTMAQSKDTAALLAVFKKMQQDLISRPVSYEVKISYTRLDAPGAAPDTVSGMVKIAGRQLHYLMDGVETISNERYTVTLFHQDKTMYLNKPVATPEQQMVAVANLSQVVGDVKEWFLKTEGKEKILQLTYPAGMQYKQAVFIIDARSGYLKSTRITMDVLAEDTLHAVEVYSRFVNYQPIPNGYNGFNESNYFTRKGDDFIVTPTYRDYQIFKASPNL